MVLADYCLVITWLPACLIFYEKHLKHCCCTSACAAKLLKTTANAATAAPDDDPDGPPHAAAAAGRESRVEAFYGGPFARFILKFCKPLTASVAVLLVASTVHWSIALVPSTTATQMFPEDHFGSKAQAAAARFQVGRQRERGGGGQTCGDHRSRFPLASLSLSSRSFLHR